MISILSILILIFVLTFLLLDYTFGLLFYLSGIVFHSFIFPFVFPFELWYISSYLTFLHLWEPSALDVHFLSSSSTYYVSFNGVWFLFTCFCQPGFNVTLQQPCQSVFSLFGSRGQKAVKVGVEVVVVVVVVCVNDQ